VRRVTPGRIHTQRLAAADHTAREHGGCGSAPLDDDNRIAMLHADRGRLEMEGAVMNVPCAALTVLGILTPLASERLAR